MSEKFNALKASGEIDRIELLGDNCEVGNLFVDCGYNGGGLFRFVFNPHASLLKALQDDFKHLFLMENLKAWPWGMINDTAYTMDFHTSILTKTPAGYVLDKTDETMKAYKGEVAKYNHLKAKFFERAKSGKALYIIKCNNGIPTEVMDGIEKELVRMSGDAPFILLEVRQAENEGQCHQVRHVSNRRAVGWIREFAGYESATDIPDADGWIKVIDKALKLRPSRFADLREKGRRIIEGSPVLHRAWRSVAAR